MKQPWEWNEDDIRALIDNKVTESLSLEYKSCESLQKTDGKRNEVSKDVSAFANSAGGTIVYGVVEENQVPLRIDAGYDPADITAEWLDQVISSKIQRKIDGVRINQVRLDRSNRGKVLYVVYVPQSTRAPHMAFDNKFHKRHEFRSVPMEEYEVRDVAKRGETANLSCGFALGDLANETTKSISSGVESASGGLRPVRLHVWIWNESSVPAEYARITLMFDERLQIEGWGGFSHGGKATAQGKTGSVEVTLAVKDWSIHGGDLPIWGLHLEVTFNRQLRFRLPGGAETQGLYLLGWQVSSPGDETKTGWYILHQDGNWGVPTISLTEYDEKSKQGLGPLSLRP